MLTPFREPRRVGRNGRTPAEEALLNGHRELAARLGTYGGEQPHLEPVDAFVAATMADDAEQVRRTPPGVVTAALEARTGLVTWRRARAHAARDLVRRHARDR